MLIHQHTTKKLTSYDKNNNGNEQQQMYLRPNKKPLTANYCYETKTLHKVTTKKSFYTDTVYHPNAIIVVYNEYAIV